MSEIRENVELAPYTTLKIGGKAEKFLVVRDKEALKVALAAHHRGETITVLGGGSNVLINDAGIKGLVIKNEIGGVSFMEGRESVTVVVGAGVDWDSLVYETTERGLWGLENLSGIPGTVGGAVVQNINAYGVTIADMISEVEALHLPTGEVQYFKPTECEFEYRNSFFKRPGKGKEYMVTSVSLSLSKTKKLQAEYRSSSQSVDAYLKEQDITKPDPSDLRDAIIFIRSRIGMIGGVYQSAGSFFKNPIVTKETFHQVVERIERDYKEISTALTPWHWPVGESHEKISAAFLMECTPYNKTSFADDSYNGTVSISPVHTLSIINKGGATAEDVKNFVGKISATVKEKFGIELESEVCFL